MNATSSQKECHNEQVASDLFVQLTRNYKEDSKSSDCKHSEQIMYNEQFRFTSDILKRVRETFEFDIIDNDHKTEKVSMLKYLKCK